MGTIKKAFGNQNGNGSRIKRALTKAGFEYERYVHGTAMGYQKGFYSNNRLYYTYVHCDMEYRMLRAYKEYECGGYISEMESEIPDTIIYGDDPERFVEWLDKETNNFIND